MSSKCLSFGWSVCKETVRDCQETHNKFSKYAIHQKQWKAQNKMINYWRSYARPEMWPRTQPYSYQIHILLTEFTNLSWWQSRSPFLMRNLHLSFYPQRFQKLLNTNSAFICSLTTADFWLNLTKYWLNTYNDNLGWGYFVLVIG